MPSRSSAMQSGKTVGLSKKRRGNEAPAAFAIYSIVGNVSFAGDPTEIHESILRPNKSSNNP